MLGAWQSGVAGKGPEAGTQVQELMGRSSEGGIALLSSPTLRLHWQVTGCGLPRKKMWSCLRWWFWAVGNSRKATQLKVSAAHSPMCWGNECLSAKGWFWQLTTAYTTGNPATLGTPYTRSPSVSGGTVQKSEPSNERNYVDPNQIATRNYLVHQSVSDPLRSQDTGM